MSTILKTNLKAPADQLTELDDFYRNVLELPSSGPGYRVGSSELVFSGSDGSPFYHYAMLVPCNRFEVATAWAGERVELLPAEPSGETVGYFENWDAYTIYFHDPVGNIVEMIAHADVGESSETGEFSADELLQLSEIGLVGDKPALVSAVCSLGSEVSDGDADEPDRLVFIGPPTSSIIVCPVDRGWLPLGRPAERHSVDLTLLGNAPGEVIVGGHRIKQLHDPHEP